MLNKERARDDLKAEAIQNYYQLTRIRYNAFKMRRSTMSTKSNSEKDTLTPKQKAMLSELAQQMKLKPDTVLTRALELLKQAEEDKKYFGVGKLKAS